jgi:hypothetical protein
MKPGTLRWHLESDNVANGKPSDMSNLRRLRGGLLRVLSAFLIVLACSWLALYLDSAHQRARAERFLSDLRNFPFASAGFPEVRDLTIRHGGAALQEFPPHFPLSCTIRDCAFEVWIKHRLVRLPVKPQTAELLYSTLPYFGVRPWVVYSRFEVKDGRLLRSVTSVGQLRRGRLETYEGLLPIEYEVWTDRTLTLEGSSAGYTVGAPSAITGPPVELWIARVPQAPNAPVLRAFDVDLHCFTAVLRGCADFRELVPSAWADHEEIRSKR